MSTIKVGQKYRIDCPEKMGMPETFQDIKRYIQEVCTKDGAGLFGGWGIEVSDVKNGYVTLIEIDLEG